MIDAAGQHNRGQLILGICEGRSDLVLSPRLVWDSQLVETSHALVAPARNTRSVAVPNRMALFSSMYRRAVSQLRAGLVLMPYGRRRVKSLARMPLIGWANLV